ncbi:MAG: SIMPL domain-containing protein [Anaerovibrio sp.]|uniref:SIMPL domain-containing protein n=1 Tax=Anaerovibrio sp. TaxID=1872532 RepID=UPI0025D916DA|nr:SIMPL domain-containing protein [Anaerovibrio sp.]MCR5177156.1 SIMPL domain-containing protein [Anaerovibrio sp.]
MDRIISVTGRGVVQAEPDIALLYVTISESGKDYAGVVKLSTAMTELVRIGIQRLDFQKDDLKTEYFAVEPCYRDDTSLAEESAGELTGYKYIHKMKVELPLDNNKIGACISELTKCTRNPLFNIAYSVKDVSGVKNMLLARAVSDAREKAEILAQASGVNLGPLQKIDYSWTDRPVQSNTKPLLQVPDLSDASQRLKVNIIPESIVLKDEVTMVWGMQ